MAVEYNQHTWGYGEELTPDKLNNIEGGVKATAEAVNEVNNNLSKVSDTKNTTGTTNKTSTKLFLAGATSQAANPQTYSNSKCYIGTNNELYSNNKIVAHQEDVDMINSNCLQYKATPGKDLNAFSNNISGVWVNNTDGSFANAPASNGYFVNNYKSINNYMYQTAVQYQSKEIYIRSLVAGSWINSWNRIPLISNHTINILFPKTTESDVYFSLDKICDHNPIFFIVRGYSENINTGSFTAIIPYMLSTSITIFNDTEFIHNISIAHDGNNLILKRNASMRDDLNIFINNIIVI